VDVAARRGVDAAGGLVGEIAGKIDAGDGAIARAHEVDARLREAAFQVIDHRLDALFTARRVGSDGGEVAVDDQVPGTDEEIALQAVDEPAALQARVDD